MKLRTRLLVIVAVIAALAGIGAIAEQHVGAYTGDPVATVVAPDSVIAGQVITFDATINLPGYAFSGSTQRIQLRTLGGGTNNFGNYTVVPMQTLAGPVWRFTWQSPNQYYDNRTFIFSAPFCVSTARICRTVSAVKYFTVVPVPVTTTTEPPTTVAPDTVAP